MEALDKSSPPPPEPQVLQAHFFETCRGYKHPTWLTMLKWILVVATGGIFGLLLLWSFRIRHLFRVSSSDADASMFVIVPHKELGGRREEVEVETHGNMKYFIFQCTSFFFDDKSQTYLPHPEVCTTWTYKTIRKMRTGLPAEVVESSDLRFRVGENVILVDLAPWWKDCMQPSFLPK